MHRDSSAGLPSYQEDAPFDAGTLVLFRKRISVGMLMEVNEYLLAHKDDDNNTPPSSRNSGDNDALKEDTNKGTLTLDATCAPAIIRNVFRQSRYTGPGKTRLLQRAWDPVVRLWYELHNHKTGRNAVNFYRIIRIRDESVQDSETDTLCIFASDPILV